MLIATYISYGFGFVYKGKTKDAISKNRLKETNPESLTKLMCDAKNSWIVLVALRLTYRHVFYFAG